MCKEHRTQYQARGAQERRVLIAQLYLILCDPVDSSLPGSTVRGILQARILEWVAISFSRECSRDVCIKSTIIPPPPHLQGSFRWPLGGDPAPGAGLRYPGSWNSFLRVQLWVTLIAYAEDGILAGGWSVGWHLKRQR